MPPFWQCSYVSYVVLHMILKEKMLVVATALVKAHAHSKSKRSVSGPTC